MELQGFCCPKQILNWVDEVLEYWSTGVPTIPPLHYSISLSLFDTSEVTWQTPSASGMGREAVPQLGVMIAL